MSENARNIVDFTDSDEGTEVRNAVYAGLYDRVTAHMDSYKQEIAANLISPKEEVAQETATEDAVVEEETEDLAEKKK